MLLKISDGGMPESFVTVGGLLLTRFDQANKSIDVTTKDSGGWRNVLDDAGIKAIFISGSGRFADSEAEGLVRSAAMMNRIRNYQMTFGNGDLLAGSFQITSYKRTAEHQQAEMYSITLASAGPVTFTPA